MKTRIVLSINNLDTAGMKYVLAAIAFGLDKTKFTPVIVVNKKTGSNLEMKLAAHFEVHKLMMRSTGFINSITGLFQTSKKLKALGQLVHSFDYSSDWYGALASKLAGVIFITEKTNLSFESNRWRLKFGLSDHIICLSSAQSKRLQKYQRKLTLIPTGVEIDLYKNAKAVSRDSLNLKESDTVLIAVAHLVEVKGHEELIKAVAVIKDEFPHLKIVCVGKGEDDYETKLKQLCNEYRVTDRFIFTGNSENISGLMKMADGKILPTQNRGRKEAFGAVLVEAMAAGLPVIATRSGGPEDIVVDGETGWLVSGNGVDALVSGIRKFMDARGDWITFGINGQQRAIDLYSESKMVKAYEKVYEMFTNKLDIHKMRMQS